MPASVWIPWLGGGGGEEAASKEEFGIASRWPNGTRRFGNGIELHAERGGSSTYSGFHGGDAPTKTQKHTGLNGGVVTE